MAVFSFTNETPTVVIENIPRMVEQQGRCTLKFRVGGHDPPGHTFGHSSGVLIERKPVFR